MSDTKEFLNKFYRGNKTIKLTSDELVFQSLSWEKQDMEVEDYDNSESEEDYDYDAFDDNYTKKKYKRKKRELFFRVYGNTINGDSVSLEIGGFCPYFYLNVPKNWENTKIRTLIERLKNFVNANDVDNVFFCNKLVTMKSLYHFDNYKDHKFLKIYFKTESSKWNFRKEIWDTELNVTDDPKDLTVSLTKEITMFGVKYRFPIYESELDTTIRYIDVSGLKPTGWIKVNKKDLKQPSIKTSSNYCYAINYKNVHFTDSTDISPIRVTSYDIECTSVDGTFPQANRPSDKIIQIGSTTRVYGSKYCQVRHIVCLKNCDPIPSVEHKDSEMEHVIVESYPTEKKVILAWTKHIQEVDPDIIIGYNIFGFDYKYLYDRAKLLKCENAFSKLDKITSKACKMINKSLSSSAMGQNFLHYPDLKGRVQIDMLKVVQREHNLASYKLDNVAYHFLQLNKNDLPPDQIFARFVAGSSNDIKIIAEYCLQDCVLVNDLFDHLNILPNAVGMSNVTSVPLGLLYLSGQGIKIESLLAKTCRENNHCFPSLRKLNIREDTIGYEGAIVFDPVPGLYFNPIPVLDYKSLYPSSMIEFNISHETLVDSDNYKEIPGYRYNDISFDIKNEKGDVIGIKTCYYAERLPVTEEEKKNPILCKGIIPRLLKRLLDARSATKKLMKKAKGTPMASIYDGLQLAYKVVCNSVYGYCGAKFSKLRYQDLAASTTAAGRLRLHFAEEIAETYDGVKVIYGDTDSIFIDPKEYKDIKGLKGKEALSASIKIGQVIADHVTSLLRYPQELEYEKTFLPFLIISKKRYTGLKYEFDPDKFKVVAMGLVTKRRDNAPIVKVIFQGIIDVLFKERSVKKAIKFYKGHIKDLFAGNISLEDLVVTKTLKADYKNPTQITHKVLAEKIADRDPGNAPSSNDRIPYVFIDEKELKCRNDDCNKKVNKDNCKCIKCMYLYCVDHLRKNRHDCISKCRICWKTGGNTECNICKGYFCSVHRGKHKCVNIKTCALQGDLTETPDYIRKNNLRVDYRYYFEHQIKKPVQQIFDLIDETKGVNILKDLLIKDNNRKSGNKSIRDFFSVKK
jgi:DNA polymerase delta subunit 1